MGGVKIGEIMIYGVFFVKLGGKCRVMVCYGVK